MQRAKKKTPVANVVWTEESHRWTWLAIVRHALTKLGGKDVSLGAIYGALETHPKTLGKRHWNARVRETLQGAPDCFTRTGSGLWSLSEKFSAEERAEFERLRHERWPLLGPRKAQS